MSTIFIKCISFLEKVMIYIGFTSIWFDFFLLPKTEVIIITVEQEFYKSLEEEKSWINYL